MIERQRRKRESGQGLVEFALVIPALLLTLMGIADFGRLFAVYSNLFNAAREGTRYGVVNPMDVAGIAQVARDKINLTDPELADIYVHFDSGPGTPAKDFEAVTIGDRVIVTLNYDVEMMTPPIRAIAQQFRIETIAARTISTLGEIGAGGGSPAPPTPTPTPEYTATPTFTATPENTATPTATDDPAPPPFTPTPTPIVAPIQIDVPLWDGDMVVTGVAQPGEVVYLRDIQNPALDLSVTVSGDGTFHFDLPSPLQAGHVISVQGYGSIDYAIVQGSAPPTPTPTSTPTPTPTPTPSTQYIDIVPSCGPEGTTTITVSGHQWPVNRGYLSILWDGVEAGQVNPARSDFEQEITVNASNGFHIIKVTTTKPGQKYSDTKTFEVPCPITPTPTPSQPNLVIDSVVLGNQGTLSTYDPLTFTVAVRNIGAAAANSLFWIDLYVDPAFGGAAGVPAGGPPVPSDFEGEVSVAWAAVSSLAQNDAISLTLEYPQGFDTVGDHVAYALADTWDQVSESNEQDNVGEPVTVVVAQQGTPPTPTPTPAGDGAISGSTWLYINGDIVPQGRVNISCYDGAELITETLSDQDGNYLLENIPTGSYTVIGETYIDSVLYSDIVLNIVVESGQTTEYVTLVLH